MSVVKLPNKEKLDQLVAKLTLRLGKKVSQQVLLQKCIEFSSQNIDELEKLFLRKNQLSKKKIEEILKIADDFDWEDSKSIDETLYGVDNK